MLGGISLWVIALITVEVIGALYGAFLEAREVRDLDAEDLAFILVTNVFFWPLTVGVYLIKLHNSTRKG